MAQGSPFVPSKHEIIRFFCEALREFPFPERNAFGLSGAYQRAVLW